MPIYEYHCAKCRKDVSIFFLSVSEALKEKPLCPECGNKKLRRVLSNVSAALRRDNTQKSDPRTDKPKGENPESLARAMKEASRKSKADYGDQFKEVTSRLEKGESSTSIEKSLRKRVGETMQTH